MKGPALYWAGGIEALASDPEYVSVLVVIIAGRRARLAVSLEPWRAAARLG